MKGAGGGDGCEGRPEGEKRQLSRAQTRRTHGTRFHRWLVGYGWFVRTIETSPAEGEPRTRKREGQPGRGLGSPISNGTAIGSNAGSILSFLNTRRRHIRAANAGFWVDGPTRGTMWYDSRFGYRALRAFFIFREEPEGKGLEGLGGTFEGVSWLERFSHFLG